MLERLLSSKISIVEATADHFWGMGLTLEQMVQCVPKFWPGQNKMGQILADLCLCFQQDDERNSVDSAKRVP